MLFSDKLLSDSVASCKRVLLVHRHVRIASLLSTSCTKRRLRAYPSVITYFLSSSSIIGYFRLLNVHGDPTVKATLSRPTPPRSLSWTRHP